MRLLAIDTSTWWCGVALLDGDGEGARLVVELGARVQESHAARALSFVEAALAAAGWTKRSIDAYAAVRGPGSFTGIRVALGLVRGLAIAAGRPCIGVGTLEAMAEAVGPAAVDRVPLIDAGRGEVYGARFAASGSPPPVLVAPWVGDPARAIDPSAAAVIFGDGGAAHSSRLREAGYQGAIGKPPTDVAAGAGRIALARLASASAGEIDFAPLYIRPSDAEVKIR